MIAMNWNKWRAIFFGLVAVVGCGGAPQTGPDICAMNPIAFGCGLEQGQGAVAGGFKTGSTTRYLGSYTCANQPSTIYDMAATMITFKDLAGRTPTPRFWETHFSAVQWANPGPGRFSLKARAATVGEYMVEAMDGPYHVLYNPSASAAYGLVQAPELDPTVRPVIIPAFGVWIYAPNERPDYPAGAEVITIDTDTSRVIQAGDGRCPERKQFVTAL